MKKVNMILFILTTCLFANQQIELSPIDYPKEFISSHTTITDYILHNSSNTSSTILLDENFETDSRDNWSQIDRDGDSNIWGFYNDASIARSGSIIAGIFTSGKTVDDCFVSPKFTTPEGNNITYSFWAKSNNPSYLESFEAQIFVFDDSGNMTNNLILNTVNQVPSTWTKYTFDISSYCGENISVAVNCISADKHYLFVDDFYVLAENVDLSPNADFTATPLSGNAPLSLTFTDESTNNPTSWNWNFGDGTTSTLQNPPHLYQEEGNYSITLTVSNDHGTDSITKTNYISVQPFVNSNDVYFTQIEFYDNVLCNPNNPNNLINTGLPIRFKLKVYNNLLQSILMGYSTIVTGNDYVTITDNSASYNNIISGTSSWATDEYEIIIDENCPDGSNIIFRLVMQNQVEPKGPWVSSFSFPVKPLKVGDVYSMDDSNPDSQGDNDNIIEPNETIEVIPLLDNISDDTLEYTSAKLISDYNQITIWSNKQGVSGIVYDNCRYKIQGGAQQEIIPGERNIQPEFDYVFDYKINYVDEFKLGFHISTYLKDGTNLIFCDSILFNEGQSGPSSTYKIPHEYSLEQNYPNPFNPTTLLHYGIPSISNVTLMIFNIAGQNIKQWNISNQQPGWHEVVWDGNDMNGNVVSTGVYIYSLMAGDFVDTKKMVLIK